MVEEEERAVAGEVEKEHFQCSDCDKKYSFSQTWSCKKKKEVEIDFARRPLSSNVFSVKRMEGVRSEKLKWKTQVQVNKKTFSQDIWPDADGNPGKTWNVELNYEQGEKFNLQSFNVYIESCSRSL